MFANDAQAAEQTAEGMMLDDKARVKQFPGLSSLPRI